MSYLLTALCLLFIPTDPKADRVVGTWLTEQKDAQVNIYKVGSKYFGKIVWIKEKIDPDTGKPKVDDNNPDKSKRGQPIMGMVFLEDFVFDADDDEWEDGTIYDARSGKTYSAYLELENINKLKVRGYIGFSLIGKTEIWTRVK